MTEEELIQLCSNLGEEFATLFFEKCKTNPKMIVLTAMTGALAACASAIEVTRDKAVDALNSAFDDFEE